MVQSQEILAETVAEEAQILDLLEKDFKSTISNMFKELKETVDEEIIKESKNDMSTNTEY